MIKINIKEVNKLEKEWFDLSNSFDFFKVNDKQWEEYCRLEKKLKKKYKEIIQENISLKFSNRQYNDQKIIISPSAKEKEKIQITFFDSKGVYADFIGGDIDILIGRLFDEGFLKLEKIKRN